MDLLLAKEEEDTKGVYAGSFLTIENGDVQTEELSKITGIVNILQEGGYREDKLKWPAKKENI